MKTVLIITDGSAETAKAAAGIKTALKGYNITIKSASEFMGNDLLPAEIFFLGCEKPGPDSFTYLEDMLKHINLAGRRCGVFSSGSEKAAKYLAGLVKDSEAALGPEHFIGSGDGIGKWAKNIAAGTF